MTSTDSNTNNGISFSDSLSACDRSSLSRPESRRRIGAPLSSFHHCPDAKPCGLHDSELHTYHITLNEEDPLVFFAVQELPQPTVDHELLTNPDADGMQQKQHVKLMNYLHWPANASSEQTTVREFTVHLFSDILDYDDRTRLVSTGVDLPLVVNGETRHTPTDVCIVHLPTNVILLVVQEDKRLDSDSEHAEPSNTQTQLVAGAVAAFVANNARLAEAGLAPLDKKVIPGIVMEGTCPVFFKIPVTDDLVHHIRDGTYPPEETRVTYCYPPLPRPDLRRSEGMKPLDNRREILRCFEAFRAIMF